jgi:hypothetical protein
MADLRERPEHSPDVTVVYRPKLGAEFLDLTILRHELELKYVDIPVGSTRMPVQKASGDVRSSVASTGIRAKPRLTPCGITTHRESFLSTTH